MAEKNNVFAVRRIFDIIDHYKLHYPVTKVVAASKINGKWEPYNINQLTEESLLFAYGLLSLNLDKGSRIVTVSNNRTEWNVVDYGMMQAGCIHVPVYPTMSTDNFAYIINHCKPDIILIADQEIADNFKSCFDDQNFQSEIYSFDKIENVKHWSEIIELGKSNKAKYIEKLNEIKESIDPDDVATIIYTSGTTNKSKGVSLTHTNILSTVKTSAKLIHLNEKHKVLSFLPLCHIFERMTCYMYTYKGISIYYAEDISKIGENLKELKVNGFITVPRLLEKVYDKIVNQGKSLPIIKKIIFFWALRVGMKFKLNKKRNFWYRFKIFMANKLVFSKWREALGGNIIFIGVGGASLQKRLATIFWAAGIPVYEGYGLTETSPIISVNWSTFPGKSFPNVKLGSVGPIFTDVKVKIADDGEILCKGPNVMKSYYNDDESTKNAFDDEGWFKTGDIGTLDENNFLTITDRKKEIFKTSGGKYIAPQLIENMFKESQFIEQLMVVGENQKFPGAIILPNFDFLHAWAKIKKIKFKSNEQLIGLQRVLLRFQKEVDLLNQKLGQTEKIKKFKLVDDNWSSKTGELTPTLKLRRKFILKKYAKIVKKFYQ